MCAPLDVCSNHKVTETPEQSRSLLARHTVRNFVSCWHWERSWQLQRRSWCGFQEDLMRNATMLIFVSSSLANVCSSNAACAPFACFFGRVLLCGEVERVAYSVRIVHALEVFVARIAHCTRWRDWAVNGSDCAVGTEGCSQSW